MGKMDAGTMVREANAGKAEDISGEADRFTAGDIPRAVFGGVSDIGHGVAEIPRGVGKAVGAVLDGGQELVTAPFRKRFHGKETAEVAAKPEPMADMLSTLPPEERAWLAHKLATVLHTRPIDPTDEWALRGAIGAFQQTNHLMDSSIRRLGNLDETTSYHLGQRFMQEDGKAAIAADEAYRHASETAAKRAGSKHKDERPSSKLAKEEKSSPTPAVEKSWADFEAGKVTLRYGDKGAGVVELQKQINARFDEIYKDQPERRPARLPETGNFRDQTRNQLKELQRLSKLKDVDGIAGKETSKMFKSKAPEAPAAKPAAEPKPAKDPVKATDGAADLGKDTDGTGTPLVAEPPKAAEIDTARKVVAEAEEVVAERDADYEAVIKEKDLHQADLDRVIEGNSDLEALVDQWNNQISDYVARYQAVSADPGSVAEQAAYDTTVIGLRQTTKTLQNKLMEVKTGLDSSDDAGRAAVASLEAFLNAYSQGEAAQTELVSAKAKLALLTTDTP